MPHGDRGATSYSVRWPRPMEWPARAAYGEDLQARFDLPTSAPRWRVSVNTKGHVMLKWALIFALISLVAGVLGFGGLAAGAAGVAKLLFVLFLVAFLCVVAMILLGVSAVRK